MIAILENLKGFWASKPPLVLFMLSLGIFAVVLLTLGYIVKVNNIKNPDAQWNKVIDGFSNVQFCVQFNKSDTNTTVVDNAEPPKLTDVIGKLHEKLKGDNPVETTSTSTTSIRPNDLVPISTQFLIEIQPTLDFVNIPHNITHLSSSINGSQLGLEGAHVGTQLNLTFVLPFQWNNTACQNSLCQKVKILTCVHFLAPAKLFPDARQRESCIADNFTGVEYHTSMQSLKTGQDQLLHQSVCKNRPVLKLRQDNDKTFKIMLTLDDRSAINLHLMHTSYFLFVMVITLLCYALVRGRPTVHVKVKQPHYVEVSTQA